MTATGRLERVTVWPVKSMAGGVDVDAVHAGRVGLEGDRAHAVVDRRPLRDGRALSARNAPKLLRWTAAPGPVLTGPDGTAWQWDDPGLRGALSDDLGIPVSLSETGAFADLEDSVLLTTLATHRAVEEGYGQPVDPRRWRTNLLVDLDAPGFAEAAWEGGTVEVGEVLLRLLHPCKRCTIPTWVPGGSHRTPDLLMWLHAHSAGVFGINARVERAGTLRVGDAVTVCGP